MVRLEKTRIPPALHSLIRVAETWGINDDMLREQKLAFATDEELRGLVSSIEDISDEDLFGWLEGPESYSETPSDEYVSFTCLTMAIDSAKNKLRRR